jgi:hypothetical protein
MFSSFPTSSHAQGRRILAITIAPAVPVARPQPAPGRCKLHAGRGRYQVTSRSRSVQPFLSPYSVTHFPADRSGDFLIFQRSKGAVGSEGSALESLDRRPAPMHNRNVLMGWLTIIKAIGGFIAMVAVSVFLAWRGLSELYRWYTTGELLANLRSGRGYPNNWQLITYESHPRNFVDEFFGVVMIAAFGLALCVLVCLRIRKWWSGPASAPR